MANIIFLKGFLEENMLNGYYDDCLVIHVSILLLMNIIYHVGITIFENGKTWMRNIICLKGVLEENMLNGYYDDYLAIHVALLLLMNIIYHIGIMIFESGKTWMTNIVCLKGVLEENMLNGYYDDCLVLHVALLLLLNIFNNVGNLVLGSQQT